MSLPEFRVVGGGWLVMGGISGNQSDVPIFTVLDCRFALY